ncbi:hypothetical protein ACSNOH_13340 [Streptomyces sp. URMC 127]|uniref:hypothetical protein n=1 Tax=Streptomyces sp. URMC 127 TaxID=3423402 RepID=UPI003F1CBC64
MRPSTRSALLLSEIPPHHLNLREDEFRSVVCPDCNEWHPIQRRMIKTHHLDRATRGGKARRCPGSARRITMDISVEQWWDNLASGVKDAASRHGTRVIKKSTKPVTPVSRMGIPYTTLVNSWRAHRALCRACRDTHPCDHGQLLQARITGLARAALVRQNNTHPAA